MMQSEARIQVIGIGNIDREDDGVGHVVAEQLSRLHQDWEILLVRQLLPELATSISDCERLIFVDGAVDLLPGIVVVDRVSTATSTLISHQLAPAQFMALVELMKTSHSPFTNLPDAWCVKIGVGRLGFGRQLSADVQASVQHAIEAIEEIANKADSTVHQRSMSSVG